MTAVLKINPKWKLTEVNETLSRYRIKLEYNDDMNLLDFKFNENGFVFIQKSTDSQEKLRDHRKLLVKLHNKYPDLVIQALVDYTDTLLFNAIQRFATVELKIQVIPVDSIADLGQYLERLTDSKDDKNPFLKDLNMTKSSDILINSIRTIPKIGDKNAKTLAIIFQNLKNLSNASYDELKDVIGANCSKAVVDHFSEKKDVN